MRIRIAALAASATLAAVCIGSSPPDASAQSSVGTDQTQLTRSQWQDAHGPGVGGACLTREVPLPT